MYNRYYFTSNNPNYGKPLNKKIERTSPFVVKTPQPQKIPDQHPHSHGEADPHHTPVPVVPTTPHHQAPAQFPHPYGTEGWAREQAR